MLCSATGSCLRSFSVLLLGCPFVVVQAEAPIPPQDVDTPVAKAAESSNASNENEDGLGKGMGAGIGVGILEDSYGVAKQQWTSPEEGRGPGGKNLMLLMLACCRR